MAQIKLSISFLDHLINFLLTQRIAQTTGTSGMNVIMQSLGFKILYCPQPEILYPGIQHPSGPSPRLPFQPHLLTQDNLHYLKCFTVP